MTFYQEPEPVSVAEMEAGMAPSLDEERLATHKQSLVIEMVSIEKSEFERMHRFYARRYVIFGLVAMVACLLGMLLRLMGDAQ